MEGQETLLKWILPRLLPVGVKCWKRDQDQWTYFTVGSSSCVLPIHDCVHSHSRVSYIRHYETWEGLAEILFHLTRKNFIVFSRKKAFFSSLRLPLEATLWKGKRGILFWSISIQCFDLWHVESVKRRKCQSVQPTGWWINKRKGKERHYGQTMEHHIQYNRLMLRSMSGKKDEREVFCFSGKMTLFLHCLPCGSESLVFNYS